MSADILALSWDSLDNLWAQSALKSVGILAAVLLPAGTFVYLFLFKMVSFMQSRLGPMETGPYGSLQLLAEVGKFLQKEDIIPERADRLLFKAAPYLVVSTVLLVYIVVPFGPDMTFISGAMTGGIFFAVAIASVSTLGVIVAGWASANKYSLMGGLRAGGQLSPELPLILAVVGVVIRPAMDMSRSSRPGPGDLRGDPSAAYVLTIPPGSSSS